MLDLHNNISAIRAISPVAIGTTGTGKTSKAIDRQGFAGVEFICNYGTVTQTSGTFTVLITEAATTGASFTSVADADLIGTEAGAGLAGAVRVSGTTMNVSKRVGYRGSKRYVKIKMSSTVTAGTPIDATAILYGPSKGPVT
jgi:hypothetical protein